MEIVRLRDVLFTTAGTPSLVSEVGYVPLPQRVYELALERFEQRVAGSVFQGAEPGVSIVQLLGG